MSVDDSTVSTVGGKDVATRGDETALLASLDTDTLASIQSADDVLELLRSHGITATHAHETLGDGFALVQDKEQLIGAPFIVLKWEEYPGDYGYFVAMHIVTRDPVNGVSKFVVVDGSTGIKEQLGYFYEKTGRSTGLVCNNGLRVSEYQRCETHGTIHKKEDPQRDASCVEKPGRTFYIDTSA